MHLRTATQSYDIVFL